MDQRLDQGWSRGRGGTPLRCQPHSAESTLHRIAHRTWSVAMQNCTNWCALKSSLMKNTELCFGAPTLCVTLHLTALCWTVPWHPRHPLTMHCLVSALYCIAMPCRPPGLVGLVGTCGQQRCGDSAITTGESEELPPPRSPPCQSPRPPPSPLRMNSMVWWECNYKGSRSKVGARTAWHLKSSTGLDFPRASCFWCFPHIGPTFQ